jgi:hypothetical protein
MAPHRGELRLTPMNTTTIIERADRQPNDLDVVPVRAPA